MTHGKIYRTTGPLPQDLSQTEWTEYARGLHQPIGLLMHEDRLYVSQKPELTELVDSDEDGRVETFRTVMGAWGLSKGLHEYTFGLAADREDALWVALNTGNFWTHPDRFCWPGRFRGSILKVDRRGRISEVARGCRVPNGVAANPAGDVFFCDNQGDWIQVCKIAHVQPGRFYGHPERASDALPEGTYPDGRTACWMPYPYMRSASGPVFDTSAGEFGPFAGQLFIGDVGYGANPGLMRVALEKVDGAYQGAAFRFLTDEPRGPGRMAFGPDGQLYIGSLTSGLQRLSFGGRIPMEIHHVALRRDGSGFVVHFTKPLAADSDPRQSVHARRWHYLYSGNYGSPRVDEQEVPLTAVEVSDDRRSIKLTLPVESHPIGMVYYLDCGDLKAEDGEPLNHSEAWYTVNETGG